MIIRIRAKGGVHRIEIEENISEVYSKVEGIFGCSDFNLRSMDGGKIIPRGMKGYLLSDGELFQLEECGEASKMEKKGKAEDGMIREKSELCLHGPNEMCQRCLPIAPYDREYLKRKKIKHVSFGAYLMQQKSILSTSVHVLDEERFKMKLECTKHAPYPMGICLECRPRNITLKTQDFRMIDHVEFDSANIMNWFIQGWRESGAQQFGYLYGKYEKYAGVPLGWKAVVSLIWTPKQKGNRYKIEFEDVPNDVSEIAGLFGLVRVGAIWTDLHNIGGGKVEHRRGEGYFLSGAEIMFSAKEQNKNKFETDDSMTGMFGSRYVTAVVSGNKENEIDISCYQISNTGMRLVEDGLIGATERAELLYVKSSDLPSPSIFFKEMGEGGAECLKEAKMVFPCDYLLVSLSNGFHTEKTALFSCERLFPLHITGVDNSVMRIKEHSDMVENADDGLKMFSSFGFIHALFGLDILSDEEIRMAISAIKNKDQLLFETFIQRESYLTIKTVAGHVEDELRWSCRHCTYENISQSQDCEMCMLPKEE
eukprot:GHVN01098507.1.p1 GENE.GHVN01098507.1~~GHVN01098507.1.p1  ORF type:complete len:538 (-),score=68.80 GHVN01098507.1:2104-3717(-)